LAGKYTFLGRQSEKKTGYKCDSNLSGPLFEIWKIIQSTPTASARLRRGKRDAAAQLRIGQPEEQVS
jgi:hypothetical protein